MDWGDLIKLVVALVELVLPLNELAATLVELDSPLVKLAPTLQRQIPLNWTKEDFLGRSRISYLEYLRA